MHRGGTSAVAGLLVRLGAQGPKTLMPADPDNPAGYCESAVFYELHERVLRAAGSRWDAFTRLEPERLRLAMPDDLSDECRGALHAEFGDAPRFVLKDPRMCRFVPFWLQTLEAERIAPAAILVLRSPPMLHGHSPRETASSRTSRSSFGSGMYWTPSMIPVLSDEPSCGTRNCSRTGRQSRNGSPRISSHRGQPEWSSTRRRDRSIRQPPALSPPW